jgi:predicted SAM-dependent methyltransferase
VQPTLVSPRTQITQPKLLNLGCGENIHPDWINLDIAPSLPEVQRLDARKDLPFPDNYFDACYNSHVLEHLQPEEAIAMIQQVQRVLKPGGIFRLVVPDLEGIARLYLQVLEQAEQNASPEAWQNYEWMMLEMIDQLVRSQPSGRMGQYLDHLGDLSDQRFVRSRLGADYERYENLAPKTLWQKLKTVQIMPLIERIRVILAEIVVTAIAGRTAKAAFREGMFRQSGEVHRWMYDRLSLKRLLTQTGFTTVGVCQPDQSQIPDFNRYELDLYQGRVKKPDSLFIEAIKS